MAVIDHSRGLIVIGVVYDGPAEAGKTTSLRALAKTFGGTVYTPEEALGRTVYFDWLSTSAAASTATRFAVRS